MRFFCENPLVLLGIALVAINDHVLKHSAWSGVMTGKLSDFAGTFFFPFLLLDLSSLWRRSWQHSSKGYVACLGATAALMIALKTSPAALQIFSRLYALCGWSVFLVQDQTDLWALLMLPLAWIWYRHLRGSLYA